MGEFGFGRLEGSDRRKFNGQAGCQEVAMGRDSQAAG